MVLMSKNRYAADATGFFYYAPAIMVNFASDRYISKGTSWYDIALLNTSRDEQTE